MMFMCKVYQKIYNINFPSYFQAMLPSLGCKKKKVLVVIEQICQHCSFIV